MAIHRRTSVLKVQSAHNDFRYYHSMPICMSVTLYVGFCLSVCRFCLSVSFLTNTYILCFRKNQSFSGAKSIVYLDLEREKVEKILKKLDNHIIKRDGELFYSNFPSQIFLYRITYWNCIHFILREVTIRSYWHC